jgi:hypothetical protein
MEKFDSTWRKYMPLIRLMMRRAAKESQLLSLSKFDFIKAGAATKGSHGFKISFVKGSAENALHHQLAKDFLSAMMRDAAIKEMLASNDYDIGMNSKFELSIKNRTATIPVQETAEQQD